MRKGISLVAVLAVLAQGPSAATAQQDGQRQIAPPRPQGLCSPLAALPRLAPEDQQQRQDQHGYLRRTKPVPHGGERVAPAAADVTSTSASPPPPPMAKVDTSETSTEAEAADAAPIAITGSKVEGSAAREVDGDSRSATPYPGRPHPRPRPQSGQLTAGEHDDLLNPELYSHYAKQSNLGQEIRSLPMLDTSRVLTVTVRDNAGRPVPFAGVEVACADGNRMRLNTLADGSVTLFPQVDRLGSKVRVRTGTEDWREVAIANGRGGQRVDFTVSRVAPAVKKLDLLLVIDTTGSMGDEIRYLQSELGAILQSLRQRHPGLDLKVGFVFYKDIGDNYVTSTFPLTSDFNAAQAELRRQGAGGGGDYPEAMDQALIRAAGQQWRPDAVKTMLLVADAPPHDQHFGTTWLAARHLRAQRVQIVPVAASGVADKAEYAMRAMAALTQSRYTFLTDDSGIGNPHAAPAIDCYLVTRLDALLRRVIDSQLSGRRIEPNKQEVIRSVGQYDNGRCIIPRGALQQQ